VIGVAEYDLGLYIVFQVSDVQCFDSPQGAYGHKDGGFYLAVGGGDDTGTGIALGIFAVYYKLHLVSKLRAKILIYLKQKTIFAKPKPTY
jgi:hypothetical protein